MSQSDNRYEELVELVKKQKDGDLLLMLIQIDVNYYRHLYFEACLDFMLLGAKDVGPIDEETVDKKAKEVYMDMYENELLEKLRGK